VQQTPRRADFRALFAAPAGRSFVIADFGQMELRVAAVLAGEERMLEAFRAGLDLHAVTAATLLGKAPEAVSKAERQLPKSINFGMLFGMGASGLMGYAKSTYGVTLTPEEATRHRDAWLAAYPAIARWQRKVDREGRRALCVRTVAGRERRWPTTARSDPEAYRMTEAVNFPVQGSAAEALLAALGRLDAELSGAGLDVVPVLAVHDEVILEASEADAPTAALILERSMRDGALDLFSGMPTRGLVEARIGRSWADK
jgi:DNA polymerase-1